MASVADGTTLEVEFERERETKHTIRFTEIVDSTGEEAIGTLYVQKAALRQIGDPPRLTVRIEGS